MHAAAFTLFMNVAVAGLFAASYATIALMHPAQRAPIWFAVCYGLGMVTPLAQFGLAYTAWTTFFGAVIFLSLAFALLLLVPALAVFYGSRKPWPVLGAIAALTLLLPVIRAGLPYHPLTYQLMYQAPFTLAVAACAWVVLRDSPRHRSDFVLAGMLVVLAAHFPVKAYLLVQMGTSRTAKYIDTTYALVSQVSSGILFLATGLILLLKSVQAVVRESQIAAETDVLSGLLNRRGFDSRAERLIAQAKGRPVVLLILDLDHFKSVNDRFGHSTGDAAIRAFAVLLSRTVPPSALIARLGGEEFAVLLDRTGLEAARLQAEAIRLATFHHQEVGLPKLTVSIGVAALASSHLLPEAMERADAALYEAKRAGRNRVCCAAEKTAPAVPLAVVAQRNAT
ncbi:GGDEF domain-containing protein [Xanthobacter versatilis]|uniref:GGDEF domain-containing protein n=1 Tax=Xanthobacter autotrophicus (strain ATCC BAA-1158 / Py2) TaxID=78245 RepID=UPI003728D16E